MKISGVYKITNNITGDFYIGSSQNIKHRWTDHKSPSMWKLHPNSKLYKDMAEFGLDNFIFEVLEETADLKEKEQYYIEHLKPSYNNYRAKGFDTERFKEWKKTNRDRHLAKMKAYHQAHRNECLAKSKVYCSRLCFYEGETLTLGALSKRFSQQGIVHPYKEAKKYLL